MEIEVNEDEIRNAIEQKVKAAIDSQTVGYGAGAYIKDQVRLHWQSAVNEIIKEELSNSQNLKDKIRLEIERKLRAQLSSSMKSILV
jgi:hypothetical protein